MNYNYSPFTQNSLQNSLFPAVTYSIDPQFATQTTVTQTTPLNPQSTPNSTSPQLITTISPLLYQQNHQNMINKIQQLPPQNRNSKTTSVSNIVASGAFRDYKSFQNGDELSKCTIDDLCDAAKTLSPPNVPLKVKKQELERKERLSVNSIQNSVILINEEPHLNLTVMSSPLINVISHEQKSSEYVDSSIEIPTERVLETELDRPSVDNVDVIPLENEEEEVEVKTPTRRKVRKFRRRRRKHIKPATAVPPNLELPKPDDVNNSTPETTPIRLYKPHLVDNSQIVNDEPETALENVSISLPPDSEDTVTSISPVKKRKRVRPSKRFGRKKVKVVQMPDLELPQQVVTETDKSEPDVLNTIQAPEYTLSEATKTPKGKRGRKQSTTPKSKHHKIHPSNALIYEQSDLNTVCGNVFKVMFNAVISKLPDVFDVGMYQPEVDIKDISCSGDFLIQHTHRYIAAEQVSQKISLPDTTEFSSPKKRKQVKFKTYDFSSNFTPNETIPNSEKDVQSIISILSSIYEEFRILREFMNRNTNDSVLLFTTIISELDSIKHNKSFTSEDHSCASYYSSLFRTLTDQEVDRPLSNTYGNYLSSIIRFYLRKEFNKPTTNTFFLTLGSVTTINMNTGNCLFNKEECASIVSHALTNYYIFYDLYNHSLVKPDTMTRDEYLHDQKEFVGAFYFLYHYFASDTTLYVLEKNSDNWVNIQSYISLSKSCDSFVDSHFFPLANIKGFIQSLKQDKIWVDQLETSRVVKSNKIPKKSTDFIFPTVSVTRLDITTKLAATCVKKCSRCRKQCGIINIFDCPFCNRAYHSTCLQIDTLIPGIHYTCPKCKRRSIGIL